MRVAGEDYALPLDVVVRTLAVSRRRRAPRLRSRGLLFVGGEQMPLIWTAEALELGDGGPPVDLGGAASGRWCSSTPAARPTRSSSSGCVGKREIVIKSLGALLDERAVRRRRDAASAIASR